MILRLILLAFSALPRLYTLFQMALYDRKRQEPLPEEVRDVYTPERWEQFLAYKQDQRVPNLLQMIIGFGLDAFVLLTPFYAWIERLAHANPYGTVILTAAVITAIDFLIGLPFAYYRTFTIENRYGLNHKTKQVFFKDELVELVTGFVLNTALYCLLQYILIHLPAWTNNFSISLVQSIGISAAIVAVIALFLVIAMFISWKVMRIRYKFVPLEEGELKQEILKLIKGSRKKVRAIEVYNESEKSTSKNAFVLKLPFIRTIGIADNFLNETSRRELLAVLSHEAGHLKHKPTIWNYINWGIYGLLFCLLVAVISNGAYFAGLEQSLEQAFGLTGINAVLTTAVISWIGSPFLYLLSVFRTAVTRMEEYEADRNAVKEGYGAELIQTFKTLSSDELVDVNPPEIIEMLEYDHPGMTSRIRAIHKAMETN